MATPATAVFAGGCFWCTEAVFKLLRGVISVEPGYTGGTVANPSYEQVSSGATGHAEAIRFTYDPAVISYDDLLNVFFGSHDPTALNRQGSDVGPQYRSAVFYAEESQRAAAAAFIDRLKADGLAIVTALEPLGPFYVAENYHHDYYATHRDEAYCQAVIEPKLRHVQERFAALLNR
jgi:peptide-methionine (S)-S-oxide reductase